MCVAIVKPKGKAVPSWRSLENCFDSNPDGAGFAVIRDGKVSIDKGFFDFKNYKEAIQKADIRKDEPALFHMRIATHGGVSSMTTHPFPISGSYDKMKKLECSSNTALIHNGIFSDTNGTSFFKDISDTMVYVRLIAETGLHQKAFNSSVWEKIMERTVEDCRVAMLRKDGKVLVLGDGWKRYEGCLFSNSSYYKSRYFGRKKKKKGNVLTSTKTNEFQRIKATKDDFLLINESICPKCEKEIYFLFSSYSKGIRIKRIYKCSNCKIEWEVYEKEAKDWAAGDNRQRKSKKSPSLIQIAKHVISSNK